MNYADFLERKELRPELDGLSCSDVHPRLYPFQADIVRWAVGKGRAAIFADCGMGKTGMQIEWARQIQAQVGGRVLFLAPLSVSHQTIREAREAFGVEIVKVNKPSDDTFQITNYERLHGFVGAEYSAIVLDESSILKSLDGKTRTMLIEKFTSIPYRLCCTATPAPNDTSELANHSEFLGILPRREMLASFFIHGEGDDYYLKGHAVTAFWRWVARWAVYVRRPSDLGYGDEGFALPSLTIAERRVQSAWKPEGMLFAVGIGGVGNRAKVRKSTLSERVNEAVKIISSSKDQFIVWCGLNAESDAMKDALGDDAINIEGKDSEDHKESAELAWREGKVRVLITKPGMFGFGMNWQHCHRQIFLGIGDSYEQYYQAIRRCWRLGQKNAVSVDIIVSDAEGEIAANVREKESKASTMAESVIAVMRDVQIQEVRGERKRNRMEYKTAEKSGPGWRMLLGDCIERVKEIPTASVGLSVFSPPFASLYTYSASERDLGNCKNYDEFFTQFGFLIPELRRVLMPGRRVACHVQQITTTKTTHGVIGWRDFRADTVRAFIAAGFIYDGEVVIDKDPQAQAIRTKSKQLMFVQKERDSSWLRPAMADYILLFRAPGDNPIPVKSDITNEDWILWARPIWYGIRESDTLQFMSAKDTDDEKHICPLQLGTIERCVRLWSNKGETVLSPFGGIGSEGFVSLNHGRKYIGIELKESYWKLACRNLTSATSQLPMFA